MAAAAVKAANRRAAGRFVHNSTTSGAKYNAVGAWRRVFKIAVKDRHPAGCASPHAKDRDAVTYETGRALGRAGLVALRRGTPPRCPSSM
jgi:hypothetical protein